MAELGKASAADYKAAKPPPGTRRLKTPDGTRQVRFDNEGKTSGYIKGEQQGTFNDHANKASLDPFPGVGPAPGSQLHWYTSANPTQSVNCQPHTPGGGFAQPQQQQGYFAAPPSPFPFPPSTPTPLGPFGNTTPGVTYIGQPSVQVNMAADYQNAAPPPTGVHYQPPVPDTTFGPIPHVYVPRFDGGLMVPGVQVGPPSVQFVSPPACATVVMPKTVYLNGYTYYASRLQILVVAVAVAVAVAIAVAVVVLPSARCQVARQQPQQAPQPCVQGGFVVTQQPVYLQQQPVMAAPQQFVMQQQPAIAPQPQMIPGVPAVGIGGVAAPMMSGGLPVFAGNYGHVPEVSGLGRTTGEEQLRQIKYAHAHRLYEPQDFKPADDDPSRYYFVREVDGNWTQRNRFTIDSMGDCRWYVTDEGWFYAVRLPD
ncbi:Fc.00g077780.m01.CDS01 [Cosmosporella sp. VM-42]